MLKLDEEPPQALAVVRWGRDLVMEAPGWLLPHGLLCTPARGFLDLAGLDNSIESQTIGILRWPPPKMQADNPLKGAPAGAPGVLGRDLLWYCGELKGNATSAPELDFAEIG
jgi:hypothetical protein